MKPIMTIINSTTSLLHQHALHNNPDVSINNMLPPATSSHSVSCLTLLLQLTLHQTLASDSSGRSLYQLQDELRQSKDISRIVRTLSVISEHGDDVYLQEDIGSTLSGMMGTLAEIQEKGDHMVASINNQRAVLDELEDRTEEAEETRLRLLDQSRVLQAEVINLEEDVAKLRTEKKELTEDMKTDEEKLSR